MKRIIMMLTVTALLVAALTVTAAGAFAAPCQSGNPSACPDPGSHGTTVVGTFEAPPAESGPEAAPGSSAQGGNPGFGSGNCRGPGCE